MVPNLKSHPILSKDFLKSLPRSSGVYVMRDKSDTVIYVGKAKNLKSRVKTYFIGDGDGRLSSTYIQDNVAKIETLITESERQALVLEADLIRKYKPRYNIRLKDDKSPLMVRIDWNADWPKLELVRRVQEDNAEYLGPYAFSYELRVLLDAIKRCIPLRTCTDKVFRNRVRPCLEYQIKRCPGPCCLKVDSSDYKESLKQAVRILKGDTKNLIRDFEVSIENCVSQLRFEDAAMYRDRIAVLEKISGDVQDIRFSSNSSDSIGIYREEDRVELSILSVRMGRLYGAKTFGFDQVGLDNKELLSSALVQYYSSKELIPLEIILPFTIEGMDSHQQLYSERAGQAIKLNIPKRGDKKRLLDLANKNARENFETRFSDLEKGDRVSKSLQHHFALENAPRVIECIDISHHQGGDTVGVVVCFKDGVPEKSRYRLFNLDFDGKPDDFASIKEVVMRHLTRSNDENSLCDLLIIDGGKGQLTQALAARSELSLSYPAMVGLAKKRSFSLGKFARAVNVSKPERFFIEGRADSLVIPANSEELLFLEKIRDTTHRFAITNHRKKSRASRLKSLLENIPGLGPIRIKKILKAFKSFEEIQDLTVEEISERVGLPIVLIEKIKRELA